MADVKSSAPSPLYLRDEELKQGIDLLFFAARDMNQAGARMLSEARLGHAHRRAIYFIARNPGLSVADLLAILKITKQSLNRVLNELIASGYVERRPHLRDRRMRELRLTEKGDKLEHAIWETQRPKLVRAFREAGPEAVMGFRRVLTGLIR
jgi:DNA-binding MarR family transcriptional regulator